MKASPNVPFVRVAVAALAMLLGALVANWMLSSPIHGQEEGGDPVPNEETAPVCKGDFDCSTGCMDQKKLPCVQEVFGKTTCAKSTPLCGACNCNKVCIIDHWGCTCKK